MNQETSETAEVPTLHTVVQSGDPAIIHSTRQTHELSSELDQNLGPELSREIFDSLMQPEGQTVALEPMQQDSAQLYIDHSVEADETGMDDTLEIMIDDIVDRHITALRQDIRTLLQRALAEQ